MLHCLYQPDFPASEMDSNNPVIKLCQQGTEDEYRSNKAEAWKHYYQAWDIAQTDYEACIAAHYVARCQQSAQEELNWNIASLEYAQKCEPELVEPYWGSLFVNIGHSYEKLGLMEKAEIYYHLAAQHGMIHNQTENYQ